MSTWVFLRGLTRESRHWGGFPATFCREIPDANVVSLDLPGNGCLHQLASPLSVTEMAHYCRAELGRRGLQPPFHLLAMSLGAMVAVALASLHPGEIQRCVLINTSLRPFSYFYQRLRPAVYPALLKLMLLGGSAADWETTILRLTSRHPNLHTEVLNNWINYRCERPVSRLNMFRQLLAAARYQAPRSRPASPLLILVSAQDALVDPRCSRQLAQQWHADIAEHPNAGHDIPLDDAPWVAGQVRKWLRDIHGNEETA